MTLSMFIFLTGGGFIGQRWAQIKEKTPAFSEVHRYLRDFLHGLIDMVRKWQAQH